MDRPREDSTALIKGRLKILPCGGSRSVQLLGLQKIRHEVRDFEIVEIREWEMRVASNASLRKMHDRHIAALLIDGIAPLPRHRHPRSPAILARIRTRLCRNVVAVITIGKRVSFSKSAIGTPIASTGPLELGSGAGTAPSGNGKLLPGSYETMPRTFELFVAVIHPMPPACECVTRMAGPIFSSSLAPASVVTLRSIGPMFGVICRKYWSSAEGSLENCTPGK